MATNVPKCDHNLSYSTTPCPACKESALSPPATAERIVGARVAGGAFADRTRPVITDVQVRGVFGPIEPDPEPFDTRPLRSVDPDKELHALSNIVEAIQRCDARARVRIIAYLQDRFGE